ncbi:Proline dehydrogenase [Nesidiocoris tenuis]|uniref:Proline dehydrogenase n=1 Tax=Nesidiocoris tenuis TaxID=355587 RepID=A0ABN7B0T1_9HEMI|nr:Proline dehydrogenase [Nesidiocoris tenuis]
MAFASRLFAGAVRGGKPFRSMCCLAPPSDKPKNAPTEKCAPEEKSAPPPQNAPPGRKTGKPLDTSFNNGEEAYKSKTTWEVVRAYIVYVLCSSSFLVDNNMAIMKIAKGILGQTLFVQLMKLTFYGHFVAGEDQKRIEPKIRRMQAFGVNSILDYSVEEDLSQAEAEEREMGSTTSEIVASSTNEADLVGGKMPQYHASKEFADRRYKVKSARTYFYKDELSCEANLKTFLSCVESSAKFGNGSTMFTAVKMTALGRPQLLLQISEVIMRARRFVSEIVGGAGPVLGQHLTAEELKERLEQSGIKDTNKFLEKVVKDREGVIHLFPWSGILNADLELNDAFRVPCVKEGRMVRLITQLSKKEEDMFRNMIRRLTELAQAAQKLNVRIMVDAEQTYFQPAISRITMELMNKYNKELPTIFNTYQCYLRDAHREITMDIAQAKRQKFHFGCKLVRGAYLEQERARAASLNYADPTNPDVMATTEMYKACVTECMNHLKTGGTENRSSFVVASHNEDTVRFALEKMKELGIRPEDGTIGFGQLYGMCDNITYPLGQAGYAAYKYVPYGPVAEVLPYLSRRAQENKGVLDKVKKEKKLIAKEILRRIRKGQIVHRVELPKN